MKQQYMSYQESLDFLYTMEKAYSDLIEIIKIGTTYEGRDIVLAKISKNVETADSKPALLYTGSVHAREWIGHELALKFIDYVAKNQDVDPELEKSLAQSTIYMVPCLNPDGYEYSRKHFSFWRKNRRKNHDGTIGVDLNRNFSIGFVKQKDTSSNVYGGEEPFSEAETRAMKEFVDAHDNITIAFDYHSQGNVFFPAHKFMHEAELDGTDMNVLCANMNDEFAKVTGRKYGIHRGKPPAGLISGSGYSSHAPRRVEEFTIESRDATSVKLVWKYEKRDDIFFEIYRSTKDKDACNERTKIGIAGDNYFENTDLASSTNYHYTIRAVNKNTGYKSAFAPVVKVRTWLEDDEFFKLIFANKSGTGYVGQYTQEQNRSHFGLNSLFVGINKSKGICDAVMSFDFDSIPENAIIKSARFYLYPMNRVGAKIEKFGQWDLSLLELQGEIIKRSAVFRVDGPKTLPDGEDSQMMQFDIGYGQYGGGIHYRPILDIKYTVENEKIKLPASTLSTISKASVEEGLKSGFDKEGHRVYGYLNFDLSELPDPENTMITQCALRIRNNNSFKKKSDVRYYVELVEVDEVGTYEDIKNREKIEYIGYEVAESDLSSKECQYFKFDTLSKIALDGMHQEGKTLKLVIKPTSSLGMKNRIVEWNSDAELVVKYIEKRRTGVAEVRPFF